MLIDRLKAYTPNALPMHMPGHKRNIRLADYLAQLPTDIDITEIFGFDDLHAPEGVLRDSMRLASRLWGSDESVYLVNGSTCGILAAVYALGFGGGEAVVARNCHKSVYHALEITGVTPRFVMPAYDPSLDAFGRLSPEAVEAALARTPNARFVLLTSPTYEGIISDVREIARVSHARGVPVIVDEAHGAHLGLHGVFPRGAVQSGADIVIQSLHKTLPSLTQTAILHRSGSLVDRAAILHALDVFETSSPSYPLLASIDGCVRLLTDEGRPLLSAWRENLRTFFAHTANFSRLKILHRPGDDPGKIVIETKNAGITGFQLMRILRESCAIALEMAMPAYALAMTGMGDTRESLNALQNALRQIDDRLSASPARQRPENQTASAFHDSDPKMPPLPEAVFSPKDALGLRTESVPVSASEGRVSADYAWAYPPGIPMLVPGERIPTGFARQWSDLRKCGAKTLLTGNGAEFIRVLK